MMLKGNERKGMITNNHCDPDVLDEYDFSKGVRGKHARRYAEYKRLEEERKQKEAAFEREVLDFFEILELAGTQINWFNITSPEFFQDEDANEIYHTTVSDNSTTVNNDYLTLRLLP